MRARTHDQACDYGLMFADGPAQCTCGVSPANLTADQVIRALALKLAAERNPGSSPTGVLGEARTYEDYIRGEV